MNPSDHFEDVMTQPGQNLTALELEVLGDLANGYSPSEISRRTQQPASIVRAAEINARAKLGAKTHPHMIARGFVLGVLLPRALCLLVLFMAAGDNNPAYRVRLPRAGRSGRETSLIARGATLI